MKRVFVFVLVAVLLAGCVEEAPQKNTTAVSAAVVDCMVDGAADSCALPASGVEKLEIIHFHGNSQCYSCIVLGDYAEETVKTHFAEELASGKISFSHVNGQLPENSALVKKYGATGSSLWIGVYDGDGFRAEQNINVWYKINNKNEYVSYLKGVLQDKLEGN